MRRCSAAPIAMPPRLLRAVGAKAQAPLPARHLARLRHFARRAAAEREDEPRRRLEAGPHEGGIEAALEAVARIALQIELAPGGGGAHRIEQGRLDIDIDRRRGAAAALAADDAAEAQRAGIVGDHRHLGIELVAAPVQGRQLLAPPRAAHGKVAVEFLRVEHMQRPAQIEGDEIGDVDQRGDRPEADRLEPRHKPRRARSVPDAAHETAEEQGAGLRVRPGEMHRDGTRELARQRIGRGGAVALALVPALGQRLQPPEPGGGEIAGDAAHAEAIAAVRRHLHVEHRIVEPARRGEALADREAGRQLDDALAILGEAKLPARAQHTVRLHAANGARLQHQAAARNERAGRREDADHAGARVGRAAHHLDLAGAGIDDAEAELVGVGMGLGLHDTRDAEGGQILGAVLDRFDLEAAHDQQGHDLVERGLGVEMGLEPGERRLHRAAPHHQRRQIERQEAVMPEPAQIAVEEGAQIGDAVFEHGDALDPHAEGEALIDVGIEAAIGEHLGMDHAGAENLEPIAAGADLEAAAFARAADIDFGRRLGEGEIARAEAHRQMLDDRKTRGRTR